MTADDWLALARRLFPQPRPTQFGNAGHCCECADHEALLQRFDVDSIGLEQLGNPGWDPLCYCSAEGIRYYFPALVRLAQDERDDRYYLDQLLFHLQGDGPDNRLVMAFSPAQRAFVAEWLEFLMESRTGQIERMGDADALLNALAIWQPLTVGCPSAENEAPGNPGELP